MPRSKTRTSGLGSRQVTAELETPELADRSMERTQYSRDSRDSVSTAATAPRQDTFSPGMQPTTPLRPSRGPATPIAVLDRQWEDDFGGQSSPHTADTYRRDPRSGSSGTIEVSPGAMRRMQRQFARNDTTQTLMSSRMQLLQDALEAARAKNEELQQQLEQAKEQQPNTVVVTYEEKKAPVPEVCPEEHKQLRERVNFLQVQLQAKELMLRTRQSDKAQLKHEVARQQAVLASVGAVGKNAIERLLDLRSELRALAALARRHTEQFVTDSRRLGQLAPAAPITEDDVHNLIRAADSAAAAGLAIAKRAELDEPHHLTSPPSGLLSPSQVPRARVADMHDNFCRAVWRVEALRVLLRNLAEKLADGGLRGALGRTAGCTADVGTQARVPGDPPLPRRAMRRGSYPPQNGIILVSVHCQTALSGAAVGHMQERVGELEQRLSDAESLCRSLTEQLDHTRDDLRDHRHTVDNLASELELCELALQEARNKLAQMPDSGRPGSPKGAQATMQQGPAAEDTMYAPAPGQLAAEAPLKRGQERRCMWMFGTAREPSPEQLRHLLMELRQQWLARISTPSPAAPSPAVHHEHCMAGGAGSRPAAASPADLASGQCPTADLGGTAWLSQTAGSTGPPADILPRPPPLSATGGRQPVPRRRPQPLLPPPAPPDLDGSSRFTRSAEDASKRREEHRLRRRLEGTLRALDVAGVQQAALRERLAVASWEAKQQAAARRAARGRAPVPRSPRRAVASPTSARPDTGALPPVRSAVAPRSARCGQTDPLQTVHFPCPPDGLTEELKSEFVDSIAERLEVDRSRIRAEWNYTRTADTRQRVAVCRIRIAQAAGSSDEAALSGFSLPTGRS
eukprot:TRINITY_DN12098_c0_g1_i1.p1 TRINITY_DN12098_c0_g1~~TRINITY_DN12098_c0_g1_i1.p1  ORF type:complete len:887 (+),score=154.56 TRINITY_DN12098_c0_g1_i1:91-2661(+)